MGDRLAYLREARRLGPGGDRRTERDEPLALSSLVSFGVSGPISSPSVIEGNDGWPNDFSGWSL